MSLLDFGITRYIADNVSMHIKDRPTWRSGLVKKDSLEVTPPSVKDHRSLEMYLQFWCLNTVCIFPKFELYEIDDMNNEILIPNTNDNHQYNIQQNKRYVWKIINKNGTLGSEYKFTVSL